MSLRRVLVVGGGTGGHVFPGLALVEALRAQSPDLEVLWVGTSRRLEARLVPGQGLPFAPIDMEGIRRGWRPADVRHNAATFRRLVTLAPLRAALPLLDRFGPEIVVATGGYVCGPVGVAAWWRGVPLVLLEQNARPGLTTRLLSRVARRIYLAVDAGTTGLPRRARRRARVYGNPVRPAVLAADRGAARQALGVGEEQLLLLVVGGSLGAAPLNRAVRAFLPELDRRPRLVLVHLTGDAHIATFLSLAEDRPRYRPLSFTEEMGTLLAAADLVIARAGATTLAEVTARGLPAILVPWPGATGNHQEHNARALEAAGAAKVVLERELVERPEGLWTLAVEILDDDRVRDDMASAAARLGHPSAAADIAEDLVSLVHPAG